MAVNPGPANRGVSVKNEKPRDTKYVLKRLWHYIYHYKWLLTLAIILTLAGNVFALLGPMLSGYAIDAIELGEGRVIIKNVLYFAGWMIVFYIASSFFAYLRSILMIRLTQKIIHKMREDV